MQGAPSQRSHIALMLRIIPADAGSTPDGLVGFDSSGDHPRGCGEHLIVFPFAVFPRGSSPRMRGAHSWARDMLNKLGIIPADAGSTQIQVVGLLVGQDHPRGCGEHINNRSESYIEQGSSPRMRGAQSSNCSAFAKNGIIPADAGSTGPSTPWTIGTGDHPRGCGEHSIVGP